MCAQAHPGVSGGAPGERGIVMTLITMVIYLIIVGVLLWLINQYIPMAPPIKTIINVVVVIVVVLWLLRVFGVMGPTVGG